MSLEALGWNLRWQEKFGARGCDGLVPARVVAEHRGRYRIATEDRELAAGTTGRLRNLADQRSDLPGVGDFVGAALSEGDSPAMIEAVLPRTSALIRKASGKPSPQLLAANVDVVFIVTSMGDDFNLPRLKRYFALVQKSGAAPVIVVNKSDLKSTIIGLVGEIEELGNTMPVHVISARVRESTQVLEQYFSGNRTIALIGSSGVGKSTLTNQLVGRDAQATQEVRGHDGRGRHTTTSRHLLVRPQGGILIDTPGLRGLETWDAKASQTAFDDIESLALQCRFRNCRHNTEPACAVRSAVARGDLAPAILSDYIKRAPEH
ncbi:MAG: ribosome small subunit-dependent GTPase A [Pseudomonadota bacterium]